MSESTASFDSQAVLDNVLTTLTEDVQATLDRVAGSATRLLGSFDARIWLKDGDQFLRVAHFGPLPSRGGQALERETRPTLRRCCARVPGQTRLRTACGRW